VENNQRSKKRGLKRLSKQEKLDQKMSRRSKYEEAFKEYIGIKEVK